MKKRMHAGLMLVAIAVAFAWGSAASAQDLESQPSSNALPDYDGPPLEQPVEAAPVEVAGGV